MHFSDVKRWAAERGFHLHERKFVEETQVYALTWHDADGKYRKGSVSHLAEVVPLVESLIRDGKAARRGEWFLSWYLLHPENPTWQERYPWAPPLPHLDIHIREGAPVATISTWLFDPNAYASPDACMAQVPLLTLEWSAFPRLSVEIIPLLPARYKVPHPQAPEVVDALVAAGARYVAAECGYRGADDLGELWRREPGRVVHALQTGAGARGEDVRAAMARLLRRPAPPVPNAG